MKNRIHFFLGITLFLIASSVQAQPSRTWVSEFGNNDNDCSDAAPCRDFAGAISKTAAGGEISVQGPGDFGPVTITKSITINAASALAGIQVSGTNAVNVVVTDPFDPGIVILRGLSINGSGGPLAGLNGIRYLAGAKLIIEHCTIDGFGQSAIEVSLAGPGNLLVKDTTLTGGAAGIHLTSTTGTGALTVVVDHSTIQGATKGIDSLYGFTQVTNSLITGNTGFGILAGSTSFTIVGTVNVANSLLAYNNVAVQANTLATVRLSNNEIFDNGMSIGCGPGTVATAGDNKKAGNAGDVRGCRATGTVTVF